MKRVYLLFGVLGSIAFAGVAAPVHAQIYNTNVSADGSNHDNNPQMAWEKKVNGDFLIVWGKNTGSARCQDSGVPGTGDIYAAYIAAPQLGENGSTSTVLPALSSGGVSGCPHTRYNPHASKQEFIVTWEESTGGVIKGALFDPNNSYAKTTFTAADSPVGGFSTFPC